MHRENRFCLSIMYPASSKAHPLSTNKQFSAALQHARVLPAAPTVHLLQPLHKGDGSAVAPHVLTNKQFKAATVSMQQQEQERRQPMMIAGKR